jgi:hypothetical protein
VQQALRRSLEQQALQEQQALHRLLVLLAALLLVQLAQRLLRPQQVEQLFEQAVRLKLDDQMAI